MAWVPPADGRARVGWGPETIVLSILGGFPVGAHRPFVINTHVQARQPRMQLFFQEACGKAQNTEIQEALYLV